MSDMLKKDNIVETIKQFHDMPTVVLHCCGGYDDQLEVRSLRSNAGFYIGTQCDKCGMPISRISQEYFRSRVKADEALETGNYTFRRQG